MPNNHHPKKRAFDVTVLKQFSNFHTLKHFIVIAERMPTPSEIPLKDKDEVVEIKENYAEVIIRCQV